MDQSHELNFNTQDGGNSVINVNPGHVEVLLERSVLGRDTPPCPFAIGLRRERLREHWEARQLAAELKRHRRERYLTILCTVSAFMSFATAGSILTGPPVREPVLVIGWVIMLAVVALVSGREISRSVRVYPVPPKPPELDSQQ